MGKRTGQAKSKTQQNPGRPCVFCGGRPVNRQHVWPRDLERRLPNGVPPTVDAASYVLGELKRRMDFAQPSGFIQTVKVVCEPCNSGWMREIEAEALPILEDLMHHRRNGLLTASEQSALAKYAVLTAMMYQFVNPGNRVTTDEQYRLFFETKEVPPRLTVRITQMLKPYGPSCGAEHLSARIADSRLDRPMTVRDANVAWTNLHFHDVLFQVVTNLNRLDGPVVQATDTPLNRNERAPYIWPITPLYTWPPRAPLDIRETRALCRGFLPGRPGQGHAPVQSL